MTFEANVMGENSTVKASENYTKDLMVGGTPIWWELGEKGNSIASLHNISQ